MSVYVGERVIFKHVSLIMNYEVMVTNAVCTPVFYFLPIQKNNLVKCIFKIVEWHYFRDMFLISQFKHIPKKTEITHLICIQIQGTRTKHSVLLIKVLAYNEQKLPLNTDKPASI